MLTIEDLDRRYAEASWIIQKRTGMAALKSLTIGWESLEKVTDRIADEYDLSAEDRRLLKPTKSIDATDTAGKIAATVKAAPAMVSGTQAIELARKAQKAGRLIRTARTFITHGAKAASTVASTGRVVGKANPIGMILAGGYALGTTGWFLVKARAYNQACYDLLNV